jgi:astacin
MLGGEKSSFWFRGWALPALALAVLASDCGGHGTLPPCSPGLLNQSLDPPEKFLEGEVEGSGKIQVGSSSSWLEPYQVRSGLLISEGDIVLGNAAALSASAGSRASSVMAVLQDLWPGGVIPYALDPSIPSPSRVTAAIDHWNTMLSGAVKLVPHSSEPDWAYFTRSSSSTTCASSVGRQGGQQAVLVGDDCGTGNIIHEIGHVVGLWHEQNRQDRDKYVSIQWQNVLSPETPQFSLTGQWGSDSGAYDFASIMHYPPDAFSSNGQPTIVTIPPGMPIGQRLGLSAGDIAGATALYGAQTSAAMAACSPY